MFDNIVDMFPENGSKYNLSAVSKSVETVSGLQLIMMVS
jgi:hypothetical protein